MARSAPVKRPGGRSARVQAAVHAAVAEIIAAEGNDAVTMHGVAARSGVHATSLYRRWGTLEALLMDVAITRLEVDAPLPDTGALRSDLLAYSVQAAASISGPGGFAFLRTVLATTSDLGARVDPPVDKWTRFLAARGVQVQEMLDRARARGEKSLDYTDVMDGLLAPIYIRFLFRVGGVDKAYLNHLVDRVLSAAPGPRGPQLPARDEPRSRSKR